MKRITRGGLAAGLGATHLLGVGPWLRMMRRLPTCIARWVLLASLAGCASGRARHEPPGRAPSGTDLALSNKGGIRAPLPLARVTYSHEQRVLPFDNVIVRTRLSGRQVRELAELAVQDVRPDDFSGLRVRFDDSQPVGSRVLGIELEGGRPIDDVREYTLATSDYLADGGSGYTLFQSLPIERTDLSVLDAFIAHLRNLPQPVVAPGDRRVQKR